MALPDVALVPFGHLLAVAVAGFGSVPAADEKSRRDLIHVADPT
jgi:hypothetical protein